MLSEKEYSINLDHLEIYFKGNDIIKSEFNFQKNINESNTSSGYLNYKDLELQYKIVTPQNYKIGYTFSLIFKDHIIDAFNISFGDNEREIKTRSKITFYASFMVVYGNDFILDLIKDLFIYDNLEELRRFDIACDIPEKKENLIKHFKGKPTTELNFDKDNEEYETYYFGSRKGKKILIRIYNKILDTFKKQKQFLYDFKKTDNLTRFEIEFGSVEIQNINNELQNKQLNFKSILSDKKMLSDLFYSRAIKYNTFFSSKDFVNYKIKYIPPKINDLSEHYLEYKHLPKWWKQNAIGTSKKLIETIGINEFLKLCYNDFEDLKEMEKIIDYINRHLKGANKNKITKKIKHLKNTPLNLNYKIELLEKIIDYIINNNNIISDEVFFELDFTIQKIEKREFKMF